MNYSCGDRTTRRSREYHSLPFAKWTMNIYIYSDLRVLLSYHNHGSNNQIIANSTWWKLVLKFTPGLCKHISISVHRHGIAAIEGMRLGNILDSKFEFICNWSRHQRKSTIHTESGTSSQSIVVSHLFLAICRLWISNTGYYRWKDPTADIHHMLLGQTLTICKEGSRSNS